MNKILKKSVLSSLSLFILVGCGVNSNISLNPIENTLPINTSTNKSFSTFKIKVKNPSNKRIVIGLNKNLSTNEISKLETTFAIKLIKQVPSLNIAVFDSLQNNVEDLINKLEKLNKFEYVEQEEEYVIDDRPEELLNDVHKDINTFAARKIDPLIYKQWHLGTIRAYEAWKITQGQGITVAVIDTGVDTTHKDLKDNLVPGYNVLNPGQPIVDDVTHGTHVAGIIGAVRGNGIGGIGVAPQAKIMPIKALGYGVGGAADIAEGIIWAVDNKANVINLSLRFRPKYDKYKESNKVLKKAISYALGKNVPVICAMGNESTEEKATPAYLAGTFWYRNLIAVGSTNSHDKRSEFSNYGSWMTLSAPGSNILSTLPGSESNDIAPYGTMSGTSMATPIVSGVVALMLSKNPSLTPAKIKSILKKSCVDLGPTGFDNYFGYGRIDAVKALSNL